jgi:hypothetical protein
MARVRFYQASYQFASSSDLVTIESLGYAKYEEAYHFFNPAENAILEGYLSQGFKIHTCKIIYHEFEQPTAGHPQDLGREVVFQQEELPPLYDFFDLSTNAGK